MTNHTVLVGISDLLFMSKVRGGLEAQGCTIRVATQDRALIEEGLAHKPSLLILDLGLKGLDPAVFMKELRQTDGLKDLPVLAYINHTELPQWEDRLKDYNVKVVSNGFLSLKINDFMGLMSQFKP